MIDKNKRIQVTIGKGLVSQLTERSEKYKMSLSGYVNLILNSLIKKEGPLFKETAYKPERKEIAVRVYFTQGETELLREHAGSNGWSVTREVRYRIISSLAEKPKLNKKELEAIYSVRSSVNVLGANINRLIRDSESLSDYNIRICKELIFLMNELRDKISYLEKCSYSSFKLKKEKVTNGN